VEVPNDRRLQIPVAFTPPDIPVGLAGYLMDGNLDPRDTTATLVSLATAGAVRLRSDGKSQVTLADPSRVPDPVAQVLFTKLFPKPDSRRRTVNLGDAGRLTDAHLALGTAVRDIADRAGWYLRPPSAGLGCAGVASGFFGVVMLFILGVFAATLFGSMASMVLLVLLAMTPLLLTIPAATAGRSPTRSRASGPTWGRPRPSSSGSRRARTSSASTCPGRSPSTWPTGGRGCAHG